MKAVHLIICIVFAIASAFGQGRSSTAYRLATETQDGGGRRTTSANYTIDGSMGAVGGVATVMSPSQRMTHGYVGQLYDVTGVSLGASSTNINEGGTRQIAASAIMDDASLLRLANTNVGWSVVDGPISSINNGLAATLNVYTNTPATVRGDYLGRFGTLSLSVLNTDIDDFGIYGGDGLPDDWQVQYFGQNNSMGSSNEDADTDGQDNYYEYIAGTVPTNSNSRFTFWMEPRTHTNQMALTFSPRFENRNYAIEFRTNLSAGGFTPLQNPLISDSNVVRTVTDTNASENARFYRVHISLP